MGKCYRCGTIFKYDKYDGVCPKCSAYNKQSSGAADIFGETRDVNTCYHSDGETHSRDNHEPEMVNSTGNPTFDKVVKMAKDASYDIDKMGYSKDPEQVKEVKATLKRVIGILAALSLIVGVTGEIVESLAKKSDFKSERNESGLEDVTGVEPSVMNLGESMMLDQKGQQELTIVSVEVLENDSKKSKLPADQNLIALHCKLKVSDKISQNDANTEYGTLGEITIKYDEGKYREVFTSYLFEDEDESVVDGRSNFDPELDRLFGNRNGYVYAFIPKEVTSGTIVINVVHPDTKAFFCVYEVPFELDTSGENLVSENGGV